MSTRCECVPGARIDPEFEVGPQVRASTPQGGRGHNEGRPHDGGALDVGGVEVVRRDMRESTALGSALLAASTYHWLVPMGHHGV